jgi:uncharacterized protein YodC (DUF2158 family)
MVFHLLFIENFKENEKVPVHTYSGEKKLTVSNVKKIRCKWNIGTQQMTTSTLYMM